MTWLDFFGLALLVFSFSVLLLHLLGSTVLPLLSLAPFIESRYVIPLMVREGYSPLRAYLLCTFLNMLAIPAVHGFMNLIFPSLSGRVPLLRKLVSYAEKKASERKWTIPLLTLFVSIPLPMTGAYTATLIAYLLRLDWKKSSLAIIVGILVAGLITLSIEVGLSKLL